MGTDTKPEDWPEDGSPDGKIALAYLDIIEADLASIRTTIDTILAEEDGLLTRAEAAFASIAEQQDALATATGKAESVVGGLDSKLTTLSGALQDLADAFERIRRV